MNSQKTVVMMDSGSDLPRKLREDYDIRQLALHVIYPEKDYEDGDGIDPLMVYERFPDEIPTTSTPSIAEVTDFLQGLKDEGYENVIAVVISSALSGTFNTIRLAAEDVEGLNVFVFDTKNISIASGFFALAAAVKLQNGAGFEETCRYLEKKLPDSKVFFYMDTLKYLQKGGRIGKVAGTVGEILKLRPIISCDENGAYYTVAKIRGNKLSKAKLAEEVLKFSFGHHVWLAFGDGNAKDDIKGMEKLARDHFKSSADVIFEKQIAATLAIHTGPGLIGIAVMRDMEPWKGDSYDE